MTRKKAEILNLNPPPGPLCWLHPELKRIECREEVSILGNALINSLSKMTISEIEIHPGPRGHCMALWLRQALRQYDIRINAPTPSVLATSDDVNAPLESYLSAAAAIKNDTVILQRDGEQSPWNMTGATLSARTAQKVSKKIENGEDAIWLLPLVPGNGLNQSIKDALSVVSVDRDSFRSAGLIPYFTTNLDKDESSDPVETRLFPSWWGILPGDRYPKNVRTEFRELLRLLWPERIFSFLMWEHYALTGVDLYLEGLMDRFHPGSIGDVSINSKKHPKKRPLILGVCGTDGSGKSSHVASLESWLKNKGLKTARHKIYRHGIFHETVTDLTRQCADDKNIHLWRLQRIIKVFDSVKYYYSSIERDLKEYDVILFDRYTYTHFAAGAGRYHYDPYCREMLSIFPQPDRIYLMNAPIDEALNRIGTRDEKTVDENPYMLKKYRHSLLDLSERHGFLVLDSLAPFEENRRIILEDAAKLLDAFSLGGGS